MPAAPDGIPWLAWAVVVVLLAVVGSAPATIAALIARRDTKTELARAHQTLNEVAADAKVSRRQTENEHVGAEFPILRDELTAVRTGLDSLTATTEGIRDDLGGLHSETRDLRKDVSGIRTDARRDRRKLAEQEQALDDHLADVPRIIADVLREHVAECPVRRERGE